MPETVSEHSPRYQRRPERGRISSCRLSRRLKPGRRSAKSLTLCATYLASTQRLQPF